MVFNKQVKLKIFLLNENFFEKWKSFGWSVNEINGHSFEEIDGSIENIANEKPNIIISNTTKVKVFLLQSQIILGTIQF